MRREPLFIRFSNGIVDAEGIIISFLDSARHGESKEIAQKAMEKLPDLSVFKEDFRNALSDVIENGINNQVINYLNSYMKPSLLEIVDGSSASRSGERRQIILKAEDTPWVEAIVCYNFCLYLRAYGVRELKLCPVCNKFFSNKGKYAKYCSDICKKAGSS